jgi:hypothetical protein
MTVRTHDIALGYLGHDPGVPCAPDHPAHRVSLRRWLAVIEVHGTWREPASAVSAGGAFQVIQQACLSLPVAALPIELYRSLIDATRRQV